MADKQLEATVAAAAFQKQWFADLRRRVFDERQPYALRAGRRAVRAVRSRWTFPRSATSGGRPSSPPSARRRRFSTRWTPTASTAVCAATAASATPRRAIATCSEPPWGGLPTPRLLCARLTCDCIHRVFSLWAEAFGAELFEIDHPGAGELPPRWWELGRHRWRELVEPHRLAFVVATLERLVERLEAISGRALDRDALRERLELVNQQEEVFDAVRRLIAAAPEMPGADDRADHAT